jgi:Alginate export
LAGLTAHALKVQDTCKAERGVISMRRRTLVAVLLAGACTVPGRVDAQTTFGSSTNVTLNAASDSSTQDSPSWLFPVAKLDESLPGWLQFGGEYRNRYEGPSGIGFAQTRDFYLLDRLRVWVAIRPKNWLLFTGRVQDSRIFFNQHIPAANPYQDTWTLWEGYAQVGSSTEGWVDVIGGRQALQFGDQRVIGPSNWLNVGRTFNDVRVDLHHPGYVVSVFASAVVPGDNSYLHNALPGNNLYGVYGSFTNVVPKATFEPYVLWRVAPANSGLSEEVDHGHLNEVTIGLHWKGDLPKNFDYDSEFDGQTGSLGGRSISAWAGYAGLGKTFRSVAASPRVFVEWNYASGTKNPDGHTWTTFDQVYPSSHDKMGFADLVGRRNVVHFRTGVEEEPSKKWKLKQQFESYWLATTADNLYSSSGSIAVAAHPGASSHVGDELDLIFEYFLTQGLNFGFGYAHMFAGQFLKTVTPGYEYSYPYAYFEYNLSKSGFHFPITPNKPN